MLNILSIDAGNWPDSISEIGVDVLGGALWNRHMQEIKWAYGETGASLIQAQMELWFLLISGGHRRYPPKSRLARPLRFRE
jgi:hypothetical protein